MSGARRILIVDDSKTELLHLSAILRRAGYDVTMAQGGDEAQAWLQQNRPDLILMDVVMPGKNGYQLTRNISRDPRWRDVPIIMCTSKDQATDRIWGMRQGAKGYLVKPISEQELLREVRALGG